MPGPDPVALALSGLLAFVISVAATPVVRAVARRRGLVAQPRPDRWHQRPTALLGGVALYLGILVPMSLFGDTSGRAWVLLGGITGVFLLGLSDDLLGLRPHRKLVGQIVLATLVGSGGVALDGFPLRVLILPVTVFWLVGITNAFNLLDNMDGLSAGIALVTGLVLAIMGALVGNTLAAVLGSAIAGSSAGFLIYNSWPASIFMGDAGSMVLGFAIGGLAVIGNDFGSSQDVILTMIVPVAAAGVPLFDTVLVSIIRTSQGRSISQGGRDHSSHRLVALGLTESQTVRVLYAISAVFGLFAITTRFMDILTSLVVLVLLVVALVLFGVYLAQVKIYTSEIPTGQSSREPRIVESGTLIQRMPLAEVLLDLTLIVVAYLGAYLLKFEGTLTGPFLDEFTMSVPLVVVLKLATFLLLGIYRAGWEYVGLPEVLSFAKASVLASLLCVVAVAAVWRFSGFSRSVFVIDWLLFTWLLIASRMSFRVLGHWVQSVVDTRSVRVLIVGTSSASHAVRAVQQGVFGDVAPVGFVHADEGYAERRVGGVAVVGPVSKLAALLVELDVDGVVVASPGLSSGTLLGISEECKRHGVTCQILETFSRPRDTADHPGQDSSGTDLPLVLSDGRPQ